MTHDELLTKIAFDTAHHLREALRAVVELTNEKQELAEPEWREGWNDAMSEIIEVIEKHLKINDKKYGPELIGHCEQHDRPIYIFHPYKDGTPSAPLGPAGSHGGDVCACGVWASARILNGKRYD